MQALESLFERALQVESPWQATKIEFEEKEKRLCLRENFQDIYKECDGEGFERALKKWYYWATRCRISQIVEAGKTIKRHWLGVIRWFASRVSNGILEGPNGLVQAAKAKARGYSTFVNFKTIIHMLTGKLDYTKVGLPT